MTDTSAQNTMTEVLVRHGIYNHNGIFRIAIMDNTLQDLAGTDTFQVTPGEVKLIEAPGSTEWVDRMARMRSVLNRRADSAENNLRQKIEYIETLGEALLEEAERREWCEEYDEFAEQWDLPRRLREYDVTMTARVRAKNGDEACEFVSNEVNLNTYGYHSHEWLVESPDFSASEA